jgi:hypothetical protein
MFVSFAALNKNRRKDQMIYAVENYFSEDVCKTKTCDNIPAYSDHVEHSWTSREWIQFAQGINMKRRDPQLLCKLRCWEFELFKVGRGESGRDDKVTPGPKKVLIFSVAARELWRKANNLFFLSVINSCRDVSRLSIIFYCCFLACRVTCKI